VRPPGAGARPSTPPSIRPTASTPDAFERELGALRARLELLIARVEKVEKVEREERKTDDLEARVVALESKLAQGTGLAIRIAAVEAELARATAANREAIAALEPKVRDAASAASRVAMIEAELSDEVSVVARVSALEAKLEETAAFTTRVAAVEAELARQVAEGGHDARTGSTDLLSRLSRIESAVDALTDRLSRLESPKPHARAVSTESVESVETPDGDDLRRIKGIGPKFAKALHAAGIRRFDQIAAWSDDDVSSIAERIGVKKDRIVRDGWVASARALVGR
jgi:predicted flap endonuclease-1-like 5' DNA nuclease